METVIYHNPRCSKSRMTLQLLRAQGIEPTVIEYLDAPPDQAGLERILALLSLEPRQLMRRNETVYKALELDNPELDHEHLVQAMVENPILIERPIVVAGDQARIGRPPERVLEILS